MFKHIAAVIHCLEGSNVVSVVVLLFSLLLEHRNELNGWDVCEFDPCARVKLIYNRVVENVGDFRG